MSILLTIALTAIVMYIQHWLGYHEHFILVWILPILFIIVYIVLMVLEPTFDFRSLITPFIGLFSLVIAAGDGQSKKEKEVKKELDKMKAKDYSSQ